MQVEKKMNVYILIYRQKNHHYIIRLVDGRILTLL